MGQIPIFRKIVQRVWLIVSGLIGPIGWRAISDLLYYFYRGIISYTPATGAFMKEDALTMIHAPAIGRNPATNSRTISKVLNYAHTVIIRNPPTAISWGRGATSESYTACVEKYLFSESGEGYVETVQAGDGSSTPRIRYYVDGVLREEIACNVKATRRWCFIESFGIGSHSATTGTYTTSGLTVSGWKI